MRSWLLKNGADSAAIESISYNPFVSKLRLTGLDVSVGDQSLLSNGSLVIDLGLGDLFRKDIHIQQSTYDKLKIDIEQLADGGWRIGSYSIGGGESSEAASPPPKEETEKEEKVATPWIFTADKVVMTDCVVDFKMVDLALLVEVERAELSNFSTAAGDNDGRFEFTGRLNGKDIRLVIDSLKVSPNLALTGSAKVAGFDLAALQKILQDSLPIFAGIVSLDGSTEFSLSAGAGIDVKYDGEILLVDANIGNQSFAVKSDDLSWKGKVSFIGPPGGRSDIETDGILASKNLGLALPGISFSVGGESLSIEGLTSVGVEQEVTVSNKGSFRFDGLGLEMEGLQFSQESFDWDGQIDFDGGASMVDTSGTLDAGNIKLIMSGAGINLATGRISLEGETKVDYGTNSHSQDDTSQDGVRISNKGIFSFADLGLEMEGLQFSQQAFGWDGQIDFDGGKSTIGTDGKLTAGSIGLSMADAGIELATDSILLTGETQVAYAPNLHVQNSGNLVTEMVKFALPGMEFSEQALQWQGEAAYTAGGDIPAVKLNGGMQSGPFDFSYGEMTGGYQRFDIGEIKGEMGQNFYVTSIGADALQVVVPGDLPLAISARQVGMAEVATDDFHSWNLGTLEITDISGLSTVNDKQLFSLGQGSIEEIKADSTGRADIGQVVLSAIDFLQGQADKGTSVGSLKKIIAANVSFAPETGVAIQSTDIETLDFNVVRDKDGNINISTLLAEMKKSAAQETEAEDETGSAGTDSKSDSETVAQQDKVVAGNDTSGDEEQAKSSSGVKLETFKLGGDSSLKFVDYTLPIPFKTNLVLNEFNVKGLDSSTPDKRADVLFKGVLEGRAPLEITGNIAPFGAKPAMQFTLDLKNYPLSSLSAYTVQAVGTALASGMLKLHSTMNLENDYLDLENDVELKKLETKTISPELAAELNNQLPIPLDAALSILRDSERNISLNIPLKGPVSDLSVGVSDVIITALGKAIVPAASSYLVYSLGPYGALAYVGMKVGEKMLQVSLPPVVYEPGKAEIPTDKDEYLERVAKILKDRPETDLQLCPQVAAWEFDSDLEEKSGSEKAGKKEDKEKSVENDAGEEKDIAAAGTDEGNNEQLIQLGQQRAEALKQHLVDKFGVAPERLLICETAIATEKDTEPAVLLQM